MIRILDQKFLQNKWRYVAQSTMASVSILFILLLLNIFNQTALIASLGASTFIVFVMPSAYSAQPRSILGGYGFGFATGVLASIIARSSWIESLHFSQVLQYTVFSALAVGVATFLMVITNAEHPPAAGFALGLVLNSWEPLTLLYVALAVMLLAAIKVLLHPYLIDLH